MGSRAAVVVAVGLLVALAAPVAAQAAGGAPPAEGEAAYGYAGGSVPVVLYGHLWDLLNKAPLNTQPMPAGMDLHRGFGKPSVKGNPATEGLSSPNVLYFYSSASFVQYDVLENGVPRFHPERGISYDVEIDPAVEPTFYWYVSADATEVNAAGQDPGDSGALPGKVGVLPRLTVEVTVREGDAVGGNLDEGQLVARGRLTKDVVNALDGGATEFAVPLRFEEGVTRIRATEGYNVKVEWFQLDAAGQRVTQGDWNLRTGAEFPNRLEWNILNPLRILTVHPQFVGDQLAIHLVANSPWGNYDVDVGNVTLEIGGGPTPAMSVRKLGVVQRFHEHNHHGEPVEVTWVWDYRADGAQPGLYVIKVRAANNQGTAVAERVASVTIREGGAAGEVFSDNGERLSPAAVEEGPKEAPGPVAFALVGAVAAAAFAFRRVR